MILTDAQIKDAVSRGEIFIEDFDEKYLEPASYDLRIGSTGATGCEKGLVDIEKHGWLEIEPGDFGLVLIKEEIKFSTLHIARLGLKSSFAKQGVIATTGPQIDPGFEGRLKVGLTNISPRKVRLHYNQPFLTIEIHRLSEPASRPYSGYNQYKGGLEARDIDFLPTEATAMTWSQVITSLQKLSADVHALNRLIPYGLGALGVLLTLIGVGVSILLGRVV